MAASCGCFLLLKVFRRSLLQLIPDGCLSSRLPEEGFQVPVQGNHLLDCIHGMVAGTDLAQRS